MLVEICCEGIEDALAAQAGGADRVELCDYLAQGGITPSFGAIAVACQRLTIPVHVLIRPRPGDFIYSDAEFEVMRHDVTACRAAGAAGVVLGVLNRRMVIDEERTRILVEEARPMSVTFHRAFDETPSREESLETLVGLGLGRILTSGCVPDALHPGVRPGSLSWLAAKAGGRIGVLGCGGVGVAQLGVLHDAGIREIHAGSSVRRHGRTDAGAVRELVQTARLIAETRDQG